MKFCSEHPPPQLGYQCVTHYLVGWAVGSCVLIFIVPFSTRGEWGVEGVAEVARLLTQFQSVSGRCPDITARACLPRSWSHRIGVALLACALANSQWYLVFLAAIGVGEGLACVGPFAFPQTLAGPNATGKWTGLQNGFANVAGVVAPALTGFLVDRTGNFRSRLRYWSLAASRGCLWSAESKK